MALKSRTMIQKEFQLKLNVWMKKYTDRQLKCQEKKFSRDEICFRQQKLKSFRRVHLIRREFFTRRKLIEILCVRDNTNMLQRSFQQLKIITLINKTILMKDFWNRNMIQQKEYKIERRQLNFQNSQFTLQPKMTMQYNLDQTHNMYQL
ncbi:unnamed protein product [Paramecium pentaurelia]|uniref:Uncharacterized protein n=1 Tax=Paramecium pentaurelia TaxID=43138 RepID=A0A8S1VRK6_9CILI|nr:unnamed protein product [Paramecium pentaurelia]